MYFLTDYNTKVNNNFNLVIAKYNENLSWLENIDINKDNVYIYSKNGVKYEENVYKNNILLENIGRESHTYLHYIVNNYNNLNDFTVFVQGRFDDHVSLDKLFTEKTEFISCEYEENFRLDEWKGILNKNKYDLNLDQWIKKFVEPNMDEYTLSKKIYWKPGAIFTIPKNKILSRPIEFYEILLNQLDNINPEEGHFFERSWYYIFNLHKE